MLNKCKIKQCKNNRFLKLMTLGGPPYVFTALFLLYYFNLIHVLNI